MGGEADEARMIRTSSASLSRGFRGCMLVPGSLVLGALGWWVAGPLLAAPLVCLSIWSAVRRWSAIEEGFRVDGDGFDVIKAGVAKQRVQWADVAAIEVDRRVRPRAFPGLMRLDAEQDRPVPVVRLHGNRELEIWLLTPPSDDVESASAELDTLMTRLRTAHDRWALDRGGVDAARIDLGSTPVSRPELPPSLRSGADAR